MTGTCESRWACVSCIPGTHLDLSWNHEYVWKTCLFIRITWLKLLHHHQLQSGNHSCINIAAQVTKYQNRSSVTGPPLRPTAESVKSTNKKNSDFRPVLSDSQTCHDKSRAARSPNLQVQPFSAASTAPPHALCLFSL